MNLRRLKRLYQYGLSFGMSQAIVLLSYKKYKWLYYKALIWKKKSVFNYIEKKFRFILYKYQYYNIENNNIDKNYTIWIYWAQGESNMPPLVKACYNSVKYHFSNQNVVLLTDNNISEYINIPYHIQDKKNNNIISIQHYSDYLRIALLKEHGGLWLDATVYVTKWFDITNTSFFSISCNDLIYVPNEGKWNIFIMGANKNNILFTILKELIENYWSCNDDIIDYFFTDYCINYIYNKYDYVRSMIDSQYKKNDYYDVHSLLNIRNQDFDLNVFNKILECVYVHKLQYKDILLKNIQSGNITYIGHIIESDTQI